MKRIADRVTKFVPAVLTANVLARVAALAALTLATILVAHAGGPKLLGELTLLRVLPGLIGVLVGCGLPSAIPFFLAGRRGDDKSRLRTTIIAMTLVGSLAASACWLASEPATAPDLLPAVAHRRSTGGRSSRLLAALGGDRQVLPARRERHARR